MKKLNKLYNRLTLSMIGLAVSILLTQSAFAETRYKVKSSENLNGIVERFYQNSSLTKAQLMVGVLAKNPRAFKGGNINFLMRGRRLTLPDENEIESISPDMASEVLSQHARYFRIGITGDLSAPTFDELSDAPSTSEKPRVSESNEILAKQETQTKKIDKLQQESNDLKKQLEELVSEKANRDQRLLELEQSLKESLVINSKPTDQPAGEDNTEELKVKNELLQKKLQETKSELAENTTSNIVLERTVESLKEELSDESEKEVIKPLAESNKTSGSSLSKWIWLFPLLLAGILFKAFSKKKIKIPEDDTIANYEAEYREQNKYLESNEDINTEYEEESLETSIKLDVARAYIEAEDKQSAVDILTEIMEEGSDEQRQQAHDLLESIS